MFSQGKPLPDGVIIRAAIWPGDESAIAEIRRAVFIREQAVPEAMEWEDIDPICDWFVAQLGDKLIAIARLTPEGRIGRMAVSREWRGNGIGAAVLDLALETACRRGLDEVELHAQTQAIGFYGRFGFRAFGPEFDEAGILHRQMKLSLRGD